MDGEVELYQHRDLPDQDHIRILELQPGKPGETISCDVLYAHPDPKHAKSIQRVCGGRGYEAVSYCWDNGSFGDVGSDQEKPFIMLREVQEPNKPRYSFLVSKHLYAAFVALRHSNQSRYLWVDAICIHQKNANEMNVQVPRMDQIYGIADNVCIWLGDGDDTSTRAIDFIRDDILRLWNFDDLYRYREDDLPGTHARKTEKWEALVNLMKRRWFYRRWVVQELALAKRATLHCGDLELPWASFANAVALLIETDSLPSQLSELARKGQGSAGYPRSFDTVQTLGAAQLVKTISALFRVSGGSRERLLTLESLVSRMSTFSTTEPRDTIYALLAMASDSNPLRDHIPIFEPNTPLPDRSADKNIDHATDMADVAVEEKPQPMKSLLSLRDSLRATMNELTRMSQTNTFDISLERLTVTYQAQAPWLARLRGIIKNPRLSVEEARTLQQRVLQHFRKHPYQEAYEVDYQLPVLDVYRQFIAFSIRKSDETRALDIICRPWAAHVTFGDDIKFLKARDSAGNEKLASDDYTEAERAEPIHLPSWIPSVDGAAFKLTDETRVEPRRSSESRPALSRIRSPTQRTFFTKGMVRANADPLVGAPDASYRNYTAAGSRPVNRTKLRFKKRKGVPGRFSKDHYSMFVEGFVLDTVERIDAESQGGAIPRSWHRLIGWDENLSQSPPDELITWDAFWRTLVADRGPRGSNPPQFYPMACREIIKKSPEVQSIDTKDLIDRGHCSVISEFLKRVQSVIWHKKFFITKDKRLGLAPSLAKQDDLICILYGCSVPVVLRRTRMSSEEADANIKHDQAELVKATKDKLKQAIIVQRQRRKQAENRRKSPLLIRRRMIWRRLIVAHRHSYWVILMGIFASSVQQKFLASSLFATMGLVSSIALLPSEASDIVLSIQQQFFKKPNSTTNDTTHADHLKTDGMASIPLGDGSSSRSDSQSAKRLHLPSTGTQSSNATDASPLPSTQNNPDAAFVEFHYIIPILWLALASFFGSWAASWKVATCAVAIVATSSIVDPGILPENIRAIAKSIVAQSRATVRNARMRKADAPKARYHYEFIGEAYVHGMMNGEAIKWQNDNEKLAEVFELR